MARKRMFDNDIINQESFLELPVEAKALYFLLGMEADDEGFVAPKKILRLHNIKNDNLKILIAKEYLILFESGVVVITDWKRNNYLDKNKIKHTIYTDEKKMINFNNEKQKYVLNTDISTVELKFNQSLTKVKQKFTQYSIEESSIEKNSIEENSIYGQNEVKHDPIVDRNEPNFVGHVMVLERKNDDVNGESLRLKKWEMQFEKFYNAYPRKVKKQNVKKWFEKNKPSNELFSSMMNSLEQFRASNDWQKDGGQFIPYPSTWLNQRRWEDEGIEVNIENQENQKKYDKWGNEIQW